MFSRLLIHVIAVAETAHWLCVHRWAHWGSASSVGSGCWCQCLRLTASHSTSPCCTWSVHSSLIGLFSHFNFCYYYCHICCTFMHVLITIKDCIHNSQPADGLAMSSLLYMFISLQPASRLWVGKHRLYAQESASSDTNNMNLKAKHACNIQIFIIWD